MYISWSIHLAENWSERGWCNLLLLLFQNSEEFFTAHIICVHHQFYICQNRIKLTSGVHEREWWKKREEIAISFFQIVKILMILLLKFFFFVQLSQSHAVCTLVAHQIFRSIIKNRNKWQIKLEKMTWDGRMRSIV